MDRQQDPGKAPGCLRRLVSAENFTDSVHHAHYKWHSQEHHGLLASLWKGQVVPIEVFRAPGSIRSRGGPPPCHRRCAATTNIHLSESDRRGRSAPELWGPHGLEEGKGQGYLASSVRQRSAIGVRHQEEEACMAAVRRGAFTCVGWQVTLCDPIWEVTYVP